MVMQMRWFIRLRRSSWSADAEPADAATSPALIARMLPPGDELLHAAGQTYVRHANGTVERAPHLDAQQGER